MQNKGHGGIVTKSGLKRSKEDIEMVYTGGRIKQPEMYQCVTEKRKDMFCNHDH